MPFPSREDQISRVFCFGTGHINKGQKNRGNNNFAKAKVIEKYLSFFDI